MAQIIRGGRDAYRALRGRSDAFNPLSEEILARGRMLRESISDDNVALKNFYAESEATFKAFEEIDYAGIRKALLRQVDNIDNDDRVRQLWTTEEFQSASGMERQLLMVNPMIRRLAQQQRIEGYADCYTDPFASFKTEDHPDYQRVMNGIVEEDEDGIMTSTTYLFDDCGHDLPELDITDQVITLSNWSMAEKFAKELNGADPTSPTGATLG